MTTQKELAVLINKGLATENVEESENCFFEDISGKFYVCALGAALVGKFGSPNKALELIDFEREAHLKLCANENSNAGFAYADIAAELLEIDFDLADAIDKTQMLGAPATEIAEKLAESCFPY